MLHSMTGFGRSVREDADWTQTWEIRSVNGRFLDLKWRLPANVRGLESRFERIVRRNAMRGRVEICLLLQQHGDGAAPRLDETQACAMLDAVENLASLRGDAFVADYNRLLSVSCLWANAEDAAEDLEEALSAGLSAALDDWNESRAAEGLALAGDMEARLLKMEAWVEHILDRAPQIKEERLILLRERLNQALSDISRGGLEAVEENRFLQEMGILAD